jgi:hypothetical protein
MLITFKSSAGGNVVMFEKDGGDILRIVGKNAGDAQGILTVDQMPAALAALQAASAADKAGRREPESRHEIGLSQRTVPLIELIERSLKENAPITWGV